MDRDEIQTESQLETGAVTNWESVIGQKQLIQNLKNSLLHQKISHAYMLQGEKLSGKKMVADLFARALQCESETERPCNKCRSCKQAINRNHPDIIYVKHGRKQLFGRGIVESDYYYDETRNEYQHCRKVKWTDKGEWNLNSQTALKTLTDISRYTDLWKEYEEHNILGKNIEFIKDKYDIEI